MKSGLIRLRILTILRLLGMNCCAKFVLRNAGRAYTCIQFVLGATHALPSLITDTL